MLRKLGQLPVEDFPGILVRLGRSPVHVLAVYAMRDDDGDSAPVLGRNTFT
jgi:hypothetical protein